MVARCGDEPVTDALAEKPPPAVSMRCDAGEPPEGSTQLPTLSLDAGEDYLRPTGGVDEA